MARNKASLMRPAVRESKRIWWRVRYVRNVRFELTLIESGEARAHVAVTSDAFMYLLDSVNLRGGLSLSLPCRDGTDTPFRTGLACHTFTVKIIITSNSSDFSNNK